MQPLNLQMTLNQPQFERIQARANAATASTRAFLILLQLVTEALSSPRGLDGRVSPARRATLLTMLNHYNPKFSRQALHKVLCMLAKWGCIDL